jgi:hypothetical protein
MILSQQLENATIGETTVKTMPQFMISDKIPSPLSQTLQSPPVPPQQYKPLLVKKSRQLLQQKSTILIVCK